MSLEDGSPVLAELVRSGVVESRHRGAIVALHADGSVAFSTGEVSEPVFPRSSNKPLQAAGMVALGLDLDDELLALACASHSGEPFHLDGVRRILAGAGLDEGALQTPPDLPVDQATRLDYVRGGGKRTAVAMNCSGKHAAMLATCVVNGWPTHSYRDPQHPLQQALQSTVAELAGEPVVHTAVDGCGAPLWSLSLGGLARAFAGVTRASVGSAEHRVARAMRQHPLFVGGTGHDVSTLIAGVPGLIAKDGAEGVFAAALDDGRAVALKIEDGSGRARAPIMAAALTRLGVQARVLAELATVPVLGGGRQVGEIRAV